MVLAFLGFPYEISGGPLFTQNQVHNLKQAKQQVFSSCFQPNPLLFTIKVIGFCAPSHSMLACTKVMQLLHSRSEVNSGYCSFIIRALLPLE
jgi:hypothetical protein